jgi:hypothetical protein
LRLIDQAAYCCARLALQYRISLGGRLRTFADVERVLREADYARFERKRLLKVPGNDLVLAYRP